MVLSLDTHTYEISLLNPIDFCFDWAILWLSGGQSGVWLWHFHTFYIPVSDWWKVVNGTGVFFPYLWAPFVIVGQYCHLNDNSVNFRGQSNVGQLMDKVHNEEHIKM